MHLFLIPVPSVPCGFLPRLHPFVQDQMETTCALSVLLCFSLVAEVNFPRLSCKSNQCH